MSFRSPKQYLLCDQRRLLFDFPVIRRSLQSGEARALSARVGDLVTGAMRSHRNNEQRTILPCDLPFACYAVLVSLSQASRQSCVRVVSKAVDVAHYRGLESKVASPLWILIFTCYCGRLGLDAPCLRPLSCFGDEVPAFAGESTGRVERHEDCRAPGCCSMR